jgi:hypothetical protein
VVITLKACFIDKKMVSEKYFYLLHCVLLQLMHISNTMCNYSKNYAKNTQRATGCTVVREKLSLVFRIRKYMNRSNVVPVLNE